MRVEEVREVEVSEKDEKSEESLLELASKDIMTVLRESRENIQSVLPYILERLEVRRLQEVLKHEIEEATYIAIQRILTDSFDKIVGKVLEEKIMEKVGGTLRTLADTRFRGKEVREIIEECFLEKIDWDLRRTVEDTVREWKDNEQFREFKEKLKEQVLEELREEAVEKLKNAVRKSIETEKPFLTQTLVEHSERISQLEERISRIEDALMIGKDAQHRWR